MWTSSREFQHLCRQAMSAHHARLSGFIRIRARCASHRHVLAKLQWGSPYLSRSQIRKRCFAGAAPEACHLAKQIRNFERMRDGLCDNNVCALELRTPILNWLTSSFVYSIWPLLEEYCICRNKTCRSLIHHRDWLTNEAYGGDTYLCIRCGAQYTPWARSDELVVANKVCVVTDPTAHLFTRRLCGEAAMSDPVDHEFHVGKSCPIIPVLWETRSEIDVYHRFREVMEHKFSEFRELSPCQAWSKFWDTVDVYKPKAAIFSNQQLSADAVGRMDIYNTGHFSSVPVTDEHLQCHEPWGTLLSEDAILDQPLSEEDFMLLWGLSVWLMHMSPSDA